MSLTDAAGRGGAGGSEPVTCYQRSPPDSLSYNIQKTEMEEQTIAKIMSLARIWWFGPLSGAVIAIGNILLKYWTPSSSLCHLFRLNKYCGRVSFPPLLLVQPDDHQFEPDPGPLQRGHASVCKHHGDARRGEEQAAVPHPMAGHHLSLNFCSNRVFCSKLGRDI